LVSIQTRLPICTGALSHMSSTSPIDVDFMNDVLAAATPETSFPVKTAPVRYCPNVADDVSLFK
jgi:hypothetical protein